MADLRSWHFLLVPQRLAPKMRMAQDDVLPNIFRVHQVIIIRLLLSIEMEKDSKTATSQQSLVKIHACFQELETLRFLNFLEHRQGKLVYKGVTEEQNRKSKDFLFNSITLLADKLKHVHQEVIREVAEALLRGESRSILIFGNDQAKKQKLMIGESQNAGILLLILSQLFNICYDREIEDKVTIKLACWQQSEGEKSDGFGVHTTLTVQEDLIEGKILIGNPEVIVRNMKSALKIVKLFMRRAEEMRELKEDATETLLISVKLEIDNGYDKQGNVTQYKLSKLQMVKLANPFSAKAKHPQWFISLFNHFQADALEKMRSEEQQTDDDTVTYIKECVIRSVHGVHLFSCFGNKMTANECLTTLKFGSYLQLAKLAPRKMIINLPEMKKEHLVLESQLMKSEQEKQVWFQGTKEFDWLKGEDALAGQELQEVLALNIKGLELGNILEYEYAVVLTSACDKLQKYIFNEEVEDYFYAKKTSPQPTIQLKQAVAKFIQSRRKSYQLQHKIIQRAATAANRLRKQSSENRGVKYLLNSKLKEKQLYQKLFALYNTEVAHFLYQQNEQIIQKLCKYSQPQTQPLQEESPQIAPAELSHFSIQLLQKSREAEPPTQPPHRAQAKRKKAVDELSLMFTNSNANLCGRRLKN